MDNLSATHLQLFLCEGSRAEHSNHNDLKCCGFLVLLFLMLCNFLRFSLKYLPMGLGFLRWQPQTWPRLLHPLRLLGTSISSCMMTDSYFWNITSIRMDMYMQACFDLHSLFLIVIHFVSIILCGFYFSMFRGFQTDSVKKGAEYHLRFNGFAREGSFHNLTVCTCETLPDLLWRFIRYVRGQPLFTLVLSCMHDTIYTHEAGRDVAPDILPPWFL